MNTLQIQYNFLKERAKQLMAKGDLSEYFQTISKVNNLQVQLLKMRLQNK